MKRRDFIKNSSLLIPTLFGAISAGFTSNIFAASESEISFSLSVITDRPTKTIHQIEQLFRFSQYKNHNINFAEHQLVGEHIADLVFIKNGSLINYTTNKEKFSKQLRSIAHYLSIPRRVNNPTLLVFSSGNNSKPKYFNIFTNNKLIKRLPINSENGIYSVDGTKGKIELEINGGNAKIHSSSCKHKTCIKLGEIKKSGENLVCIPNQIRVSISGNSNKKIDSVTF